MLQLSLRDRDRVSVLRQVSSGVITAGRATKLLGLSHRQLRRLRRRFEREGDAAVIHGLRGRRPNNAKPREVRERALARAREPVFGDFAPTLLAEHLSRDPQIGELLAPTLRRWMIEDGLCSELSHWESSPKAAGRGRGWKTGSAQNFLGLTDAETAFIETKLALAADPSVSVDLLVRSIITGYRGNYCRG